MDGFFPQPLKGGGAEPRVLWGSFQTNGTSDPSATTFRYPPGFKFTVTYSATGVYTVTMPSGVILPAQPGVILVSAQFATLATDYFEVGVVGESTLNTTTKQFVIQAKRAGSGQAPANTAGNRINFAILFNNSTGG